MVINVVTNNKKAIGLFSGIGGLELGLERAGYRSELLCEIDSAAKAVLAARFPNAPVVDDVRSLDRLPPDIDLIAAGFPCQDLSQAGPTVGIGGQRSGLVNEIFRLLENNDVPNLLLENVRFMLHLDRGNAIRHLVDNLERLGFSWAYRVLDSRAFGIPQRRERVYLLASRESEPFELLFQEDCAVPPDPDCSGRACGFYWTEGLRGLGWAVDAIPTLKGGSTIGIPSQPAIWFPDGRIATPGIGDAERLQGFEAGWTQPAEKVCRSSYRWKLVGNAVTVDVAAWAASCFNNRPRPVEAKKIKPLKSTWPMAAFGTKDGNRFAVDVSTWPVAAARLPLAEFLQDPVKPLSLKAVSGFLGRLKKSNLRYPVEFMDALCKHKNAMESVQSLNLF